MVRTRVAPSPTGNLHLGTARVALYNWLFAKQNNGTFILRMEDTDNARSTKFFEQDIIDGLKWLGLEWDEGPNIGGDYGPYYQMERLDIYKEYINKLLEEGKAYYAWETSEELDQMREEANQQKKPFVYKRPNYSQEQIEKFKEEGRHPVVRFEVSNETITFNDQVKGDISFDMSEVGDFVIMKSDGIPTFFIVNVIDDYLMNITHIVRGEDHVNNTPKQILLYEAFGWSENIPQYSHLPMLLNPNKSKMSKRDTDNEVVTVSKFKEQGFLKEPLLNFMALLGWHPSDDREVFDVEGLLENFSVDRINKSNAIYDYERALWFNSEYIQNLDSEEFTKRLISYLQDFGDQEWKEILEYTENNYIEKIAPYIKVRIQTLAQFRDYCKYFFKAQYPTDDILYSQKMKVDKQTVQSILPQMITLLSTISEENWTEENIKNMIIAYNQEMGYKNGQVLWPLRSILTGVNASPGAFEMLYVLGKEESLKRLKGFNNN